MLDLFNFDSFKNSDYFTDSLILLNRKFTIPFGLFTQSIVTSFILSDYAFIHKLFLVTFAVVVYLIISIVFTIFLSDLYFELIVTSFLCRLFCRRFSIYWYGLN